MKIIYYLSIITSLILTDTSFATKRNYSQLDGASTEDKPSSKRLNTQTQPLNSDDIYYKIPLKESVDHVTKGIEEANHAQKRCNLMLGAKPNEPHIIEMIKSDKLAEEHGFVSPFCVYFCFAYKSEELPITSTPTTPVITQDFNDESNWDALLSAAGNPQKPFSGVFDEIYFDVSTLKFVGWNKDVLLKVLSLLKHSGTLYLPGMNLQSSSTFRLSDVTSNDYYKLTPKQKENIPYSEEEKTPYKEKVVTGKSLTPATPRDGTYYASNGTSLFYDVFISSLPAGSSLKIERVEGNDGYPDTGFSWRTEAEEIKNEFLKINSYIKITKSN